MRELRSGASVFQAIEFADAVGRDRVAQIEDLDDLSAILASFRASLEEAVQNPIMLHGRRVEAMFGYVAASLGECSLIKAEDSGDVLVSNQLDEIAVPDYRIALRSGGAYLVEVKNLHGKTASTPFSIRSTYIDMLKQYAALFDEELLLAIYWSRWGRWTLVPPDSLERRGRRQSIEFPQALMHNRMSELGDYLVGTTPPIVLRILTDPDKPRRFDSDNQGIFTIGQVQMFAGTVEIADPAETSLLIYLMLYGGWRETTATEFDGKDLLAIEFRFEPTDPEAQRDFQFLDFMSSMMARKYNDLTTKKGKVVRLRPSAQPKSLGHVAPGRVQDMTLPLWVFHIKPREAT